MGLKPVHSLKTRQFLALFRKNLVPPPQVDVERRQYGFASTLPLQTFKLVHGTIKLSVHQQERVLVVRQGEASRSCRHSDLAWW